MIERLLEERKASLSGLDIDPAVALQQIVSSNGFTDESDYDSDDLSKGPYPDDGGEADTPRHCDTCGVFLENPLTADESGSNARAKTTEPTNPCTQKRVGVRAWGIPPRGQNDMKPLKLAEVRKHTGRKLVYAEAIKLANPADPFLRNMALALSHHAWNNTPQDWLRLEAALEIQHHRPRRTPR